MPVFEKTSFLIFFNCKQVEEESPGSVARFPLILALIVSGSNALAGENFFAPGRVIGLVIVFIGIHWQADLDWQSNLMSTPGHLKKKFSRRSAAPLTIVALILLTRQFRGGLLSMHDNYSKWSQSSIGDTPCQLMHPEVYGKSITNFTLTSRMPHVLVTGGAGELTPQLVFY